jgi:SAM-dependent methyltransferase
LPLGTEVEAERKAEAICPLCGGTARYAFTTEDRLHPIPGRFDSYFCSGCGILFLHPVPTPEVLAQHYPEEEYYAYQEERENQSSGLKGYLKNLALSRSSWAGKFLRRMARLRGNEIWEVAATLPSGSKVLDIGCGNGAYLAIFKKFGFECYGGEPSPKAAAIARRRGFQVVEEAWETFFKEEFDVILLRHTLEHLPYPKETLQNCRRLIKRTGRMVITVPSFSSLSFFLFGPAYWGIDAPRHLFGFTVSGLKRLVAISGWKIEKSWTVSWPAALAFSFEHALSARFPARKKFYPGLQPPKIWHKILGAVLFLPIFVLDRFKKGDNLTLVLKPDKCDT